MKGMESDTGRSKREGRRKRAIQREGEESARTHTWMAFSFFFTASLKMSANALNLLGRQRGGERETDRQTDRQTDRDHKWSATDRLSLAHCLDIHS